MHTFPLKIIESTGGKLERKIVFRFQLAAKKCRIMITWKMFFQGQP